MNPLHVTIWNEFVHEKKHAAVRTVYPDGIHEAIARGIGALDSGLKIRSATLEEPEHGLTDEVLNATDVLLWWGHMAHDKVSDAVVDKVQLRVLQGMGLVVLHSGHMSKVFRRLMGTSGCLTWREAGERERLWVCAPGHPIAKGIDTCIEIEHEEMYGEPFGIPAPEETVFISWFEGGEVFRSGCCWTRGAGRIFYFRPGHETYPTYHLPVIHQVIANAVRWAAPLGRWETPRGCPNIGPDQTREKITPTGSSVH